MRARDCIVVLALLTVVIPTGASAQPAPAIARDEGNMRAGDKDLKLDLSVPESPAFKVLDVVPQEVIRPSSPQELAGQLLNGVDAHGNIQTGLALDTAPFMLFYGNQVSLHDYRSSYITELLARTQASFATTKGSSDDDKSVRLALGFRTTPWDRGDPRNDRALTRCLAAKFTRPDPQLAALEAEVAELKFEADASDESDPQHDAKRLAFEKKFAELQNTTGASATACREDARARNWNASSWSFGVAPTWLSSNGEIGNLTWNTASVWTSLGYGFEEVPVLRDASELLVSARYNHDEEVPDLTKSDGSFVEQRSLVAAFQLRLAAHRPGNVKDAAPTLILSVEGDYLYADPKHAVHDTSYRFSVGADVKIPNLQNTYVKISVGGSGGSDREDNQGFVSATLRYGS